RPWGRRKHRRAAWLEGHRQPRSPGPGSRRQPRIPALRPAQRGQAMTTASAAFPGFQPAALSFFKGLRAHNDPVWFKPKKALYETEVLAPLRQLVVAVGAALEEAGLPLGGDPQRGIFRIYRDVRFSSDKRLYK